MATIAAAQARLASAVKTLIDADRNNPATTLTRDQIRANPWMSPKGDNGAIDSSEAKGVSDTFAKSVFEAARFGAGEHILQGGTDHLEEATMPKWELPFGELRQFQSQANEILSSLQTDADGNITPAAIDALPDTVASYFKQAFSNVREVPRPDAQARMVAAIREAATGAVDWQ